MIQRIQSVFLLLLALAMLSVLALPLWHKIDGLTHQELTLTAFGFEAKGLQLPAGTGPVWVIGVLAAASAALAMFEIFQFRNRLRQLLLGSLNLLLITATLGAAFYFSNKGEQLLNLKLEGKAQAGFYLPTLALLLNLLANRFIRRDEQLVRSADRLR
jgi:glucan phosphoethanolaminetransferase (alkaline phosphatase superfamily)